MTKHSISLKIISLILAITFVLISLVGCVQPKPKINGIELDKYTIVYNSEDLDYSERAAFYIRDKIDEITGIDIPVVEDGEASAAHEIVVGNTTREISRVLDADTEGLEFAIMADDNHIALEGDYFVIAAAAYYFVRTYITGKSFDTEVARAATVHEPIVEDAKSFIFLIGDGMGYNQTKLFEEFDADTEGAEAYSDGEDFFYGYLLPAIGSSRTVSLDGVTDSAAGGTALTSGFKTHNGFIGKDKDGNNVTSLTELCAQLGMSTAIMSTEPKNGATPASFSAHATDRDSTTEITKSQMDLIAKHGTIFNCSFDYYTAAKIPQIEKNITDTLDKLSENENGFFIMYEEAHIDKHSHKNDLERTFDAVVRFNQAIGRFMEFVFYNPSTFLLITADHETGGIYLDENGKFAYASEEHSDLDVPVFAYGKGAEIFDGITVENTQIPKTIASMIGVSEFGDMTEYPSLAN